MATLITGGCGFVGLALAERLSEIGQRVVLFDRRGGEGLIASSVIDGCELMTGDVSNPDDLDRALSDARIDTVVHTAAMTPSIEMEASEAARILEVNLLATVRLLECCTKIPRIRRVVLTSSVAVYGFSAPADTGLYHEARSHPSPSTLYGISKLSAEQAALRIGELHNLDIRVVRLGPVYGPWEHATGVRSTLSPHHQIVHAALQGSPIVLPRPMSADWIYSRDAAQAISLISRADHLSYRIYNVGGGRLSDLTEWCRALAVHLRPIDWRLAAAGEPATISYGLPADRAALNVQRIEQELQHVCRFDPFSAAGDYLGWIADHGKSFIWSNDGPSR